jgi:uncharacterized protein
MQEHSAREMSLKTALAAVDLSVRSKGDSLIPSGCMHTGLSFFGGEPLLNRDLIERTVDYCEKIRVATGEKFKYVMVTNGTLLDESFLEFATRNKMEIGLSHDGLMHDMSRKMGDGSSSFALLEEKISLLLRYLPKSTAMCTIHPLHVDRLAESVEWLFERGFREIQTIPAVGEKTEWTPEALEKLDGQYRQLSDLYVKWTAAGHDFSLPVFDIKIKSHIMDGMGIHQTCRFGQKQLSIAPDGAIYPCVQFLDLPEFRMGDVFGGLIEERVRQVVEKGQKEAEECQTCALKKRCKYNCCCQNRVMTGTIDQVSPLTCAFERAAIRNADRAASRLVETGDPQFLKKHYHVASQKQTGCEA